MFYKVRVLDAKGKLKKLFTSEMLSKRHWDMFPDNIKKAEKEKKSKIKKISLIRLGRKIMGSQGIKNCGKKISPNLNVMSKNNIKLLKIR